MITELEPELANSLCRPLDPSLQYDIVFSKHFEKSGYYLSLRPLSINGDLNVIYQWLKDSFGNQLRKTQYSREQLLEVFREMLALNYCQSFLGLINQIPAWQVDICNALNDDIYSYISAKENDYCVRVIINPEIVEAGKTVENVLDFCITYFFLFKAVKNIFFVLDVEQAGYGDFLLNSGFKSTATIDPLPYNSSLFQCSKPGYKRRPGS